MANEVKPIDFGKIIEDMQNAQKETMRQTKEMKKLQNNFDVQMQGAKIEANAKKAFNDALKATANVIAQAGRPQ